MNREQALRRFHSAFRCLFMAAWFAALAIGPSWMVPATSIGFCIAALILFVVALYSPIEG